MNATILAERTARAIATIEAETRRLGGDLSIRPSRGDAAHRHLAVLEAVAEALAGIGAGEAGVREAPAPDPPARKKPGRTEAAG